MAFPVVWAVGSFIGGLLAKGFYDNVIAENDDDYEVKCGWINCKKQVTLKVYTILAVF